MSRYRLSVLTSILILLSILTSACTAGSTSGEAPSSQSEAPADDGRLTVLEWAGYDDPSFREPFTSQHPDVEVDYSFFAEDAEAFSKLQSGFEVDLAHPCTAWLRQYVDNNLIQPIDTSRLIHWGDLDPTLINAGQVDGVQYLVPWDWGPEFLLTRTDKVDKKPSSWSSLWDAGYQGKVSVFDSGETMWLITSLALGIDPYNTTPEQQAQIKQKMIELKPNLLNYWADATELANLVASGDVSVATSWSETYLTLKEDGIPVEYITPSEGSLGFVCGYIIPKNIGNFDLVYDYLNAVTEPQSMANMSNSLGYGPANRKAIPLLDPEYVTELKLDDPNTLSKTFFYQPLTAEQRQLFTETWSEVKAAP
jgi:putative spermidine/putrescine transport system substrate-binding protein/spermidine/putrescine transport system substrate-binding protein